MIHSPDLKVRSPTKTMSSLKSASNFVPGEAWSLKASFMCRHVANSSPCGNPPGKSGPWLDSIAAGRAARTYRGGQGSVGSWGWTCEDHCPESSETPWGFTASVLWRITGMAIWDVYPRNMIWRFWMVLMGKSSTGTKGGFLDCNLWLSDVSWFNQHINMNIDNWDWTHGRKTPRAEPCLHDFV